MSRNESDLEGLMLSTYTVYNKIAIDLMDRIHKSRF